MTFLARQVAAYREVFAANHRIVTLDTERGQEETYARALSHLARALADKSSQAGGAGTATRGGDVWFPCALEAAALI